MHGVEGDGSSKRREDRISLLGLIVAALALLTATLQTLLLQWQSDSPFDAAFYEAQVARTVEIVDFLTQTRATMEALEAKYANGLGTGSEIEHDLRATMQQFSVMPERAWLLPTKSQDAVQKAAEDFNRFGIYCLSPRYLKPVTVEFTMPCRTLKAAHERSIEAAMRSISSEMGIEQRRARLKTKGGPV